MALKPVSVYLLEDAFTCQGCYLPDDTSYRKYSEKDRAGAEGKPKLEPAQRKLRADARAKA